MAVRVHSNINNISITATVNIVSIAVVMAFILTIKLSQYLSKIAMLRCICISLYGYIWVYIDDQVILTSNKDFNNKVYIYVYIYIHIYGFILTIKLSQDLSKISILRCICLYRYIWVYIIYEMISTYSLSKIPMHFKHCLWNIRIDSIYQDVIIYNNSSIVYQFSPMGSHNRYMYRI